jgi:probable rRNA maturation factor
MSLARQQPNTVVQIAKSFKEINVSLPRLEKLVKTVLKSRRVSGTVVSIAIVDDAEMRKMNKRFLDHNRTTDVISFDLSDSNRKLFELVVNGEMAVRQAKQRGHSGEAELALYVTHGLLHNLGFDDTTQTRAKKMHEEEDKVLQELGYGSVYNT